jgi:anti-sigma-K factor RskA
MTDDRQNDSGETRPGQSGGSPDDQEIHEMLTGYALGALEPDEMLSTERYLNHHPELQDRVRDLETTAASLAHAAPRAPLPARTKERLLRRIRGGAPAPATRRIPFLAGKKVKPQRPALRGMRPIPRSQAPSPASRGNWATFFLRGLVTAGALAAIALLAVISWQLRNQVHQLSAQLATVQGQLTPLQAENSQLQQINIELQQQLQNQTVQWEVIANPQQLIALAGTPDAPSASGAFFRRNNEGVLLLHGLSPLPEDQTYQLWILPPEGPSIPADLLPIGGAQTARLAINIPPEHSDLVGVSISVEPAGGSQTPTTIVLLGRNNPSNT